jgi:hypothetical protein
MDEFTSSQNMSLYSGGDGTTVDRAVVINATTTSVGIAAEYQYVVRLFGERDLAWTVIRQNLIHHAEKYYDILQIQLSTGEERSIIFDISQFFGKA